MVLDKATLGTLGSLAVVLLAVYSKFLEGLSPKEWSSQALLLIFCLNMTNYMFISISIDITLHAD